MTSRKGAWADDLVYMSWPLFDRQRRNGLQTPRKQLGFWGRNRGLAEPLLTRDFLYIMMTCLSDAPLAQLD